MIRTAAMPTWGDKGIRVAPCKTHALCYAPILNDGPIRVQKLQTNRRNSHHDCAIFQATLENNEERGKNVD